jgi:uncharacterized caspase-like protein
MADKALLVGINNYASAPLRGCVNDVLDMASYLVDCHNFAREDIRLLTDERATTEEIKLRLKWLTSDLKAGDRIVFHYSGHGAQAATRNPKEEIDGLDEILVPVDFDWSDSKMIRDKYLNKVFKKLPQGVKFAWVNDSCHSGQLTRALPAKPKKRKILEAPRFYPTPACVGWRNGSALSLGYAVTSVSDMNLNVGFISGCRSDQTSADTEVNGRPCGALTHFLLKTLRGQGSGKPLNVVCDLVNKQLRKGGYSQCPQVEGNMANLPFLGK